MRTSYTWVTWVAITLLAALATTCGPPVEVHSSATPEAPFALGHYFQMLPAPTRRDGRPSSGEDDPMVTNSIANRTIRQAIVRAFEDRGYLRVDSGATLGVAF